MVKLIGLGTEKPRFIRHLGRVCLFGIGDNLPAGHHLVDLVYGRLTQAGVSILGHAQTQDGRWAMILNTSDRKCLGDAIPSFADLRLMAMGVNTACTAGADRHYYDIRGSRRFRDDVRHILVGGRGGEMILEEYGVHAVMQTRLAA